MDAYETNIIDAQEKLFERFRLLTEEVLKARDTNIWPLAALEWEKVLLGTNEELMPYMELMGLV